MSYEEADNLEPDIIIYTKSNKLHMTINNQNSWSTIHYCSRLNYLGQPLHSKYSICPTSAGVTELEALTVWLATSYFMPSQIMICSLYLIKGGNTSPAADTHLITPYSHHQQQGNFPVRMYRSSLIILLFPLKIPSHPYSRYVDFLPLLRYL